MNEQTRRLRNEAMDEAALRHQLAEHHLAGYGWALHCCARNPAQAEDVLQNVYLKILQGKARFDGRSSFKTWLFSVIRLTAAQERRRDWLRRLRLLRYEPEPSAPPRDTENERLLQQALAALPNRQREVLHLVFYQDLTIAEAGTVMGVSLGSARTHYERGKQRLRKILAPVAAPFTGAPGHAGVSRVGRDAVPGNPAATP